MLRTKHLQTAKDAIQLKNLCLDAGLQYDKIRRKTISGKELDVNESELLLASLQKFGLTIHEKPTEAKS